MCLDSCVNGGEKTILPAFEKRDLAEIYSLSLHIHCFSKRIFFCVFRKNCMATSSLKIHLHWAVMPRLPRTLDFLGAYYLPSHSSEKPVTTHRSHISQDMNLHQHRCENLQIREPFFYTLYRNTSNLFSSILTPAS